MGDKPFPKPSDVRTFAGFGASGDDLARGFRESGIQEKPEYDLENYKWRSSRPKSSDIDENNPFAMPDDYEFRHKDERAQGFLTRPRYGTDR